jgi:hypothetical protein
LTTSPNYSEEEKYERSGRSHKPRAISFAVQHVRKSQGKSSQNVVATPSRHPRAGSRLLQYLVFAVPRERVDLVAALELRALVETRRFGVLAAAVVRVERDWDVEN